MYCRDALRDVHDRSQRSLRLLLAHCSTLTPDELNRDLPGFSYPTVRLQIHHMIHAQQYWLSVLEDRMDAAEFPERYPDVATLEQLRADVAAQVTRYLDAVSDAELNDPRPRETWRGDTPMLIAAHVLLRTVTHFYHHTGQVTGMCRSMGKPAPAGLDFPLDVY